MKIISHAKIFHLICLDREKVTRKLVTVAHASEIHSQWHACFEHYSSALFRMLFSEPEGSAVVFCDDVAGYHCTEFVYESCLLPRGDCSSSSMKELCDGGRGTSVAKLCKRLFVGNQFKSALNH